MWASHASFLACSASCTSRKTPAISRCIARKRYCGWLWSTPRIVIAGASPRRRRRPTSARISIVRPKCVSAADMCVNASGAYSVYSVKVAPSAPGTDLPPVTIASSVSPALRPLVATTSSSPASQPGSPDTTILWSPAAAVVARVVHRSGGGGAWRRRAPWTSRCFPFMPPHHEDSVSASPDS